MINKHFCPTTFLHLLTSGNFQSNADPKRDLMFLANQYLNISLHLLHLNLLLWESDFQDSGPATKITGQALNVAWLRV